MYFYSHGIRLEYHSRRVFLTWICLSDIAIPANSARLWLTCLSTIVRHNYHEFSFSIASKIVGSRNFYSVLQDKFNLSWQTFFFFRFSEQYAILLIYFAWGTPRQTNLKTEVSLWKRIKCFPSMLRRRNLKTQQSPIILDLCLRITQARISHDYRDAIVFGKLRFQNAWKCFRSTRKQKAGVFKFLLFEERLRKAPFSWRISVDARPNRRNKAALCECDILNIIVVKTETSRYREVPSRHAYELINQYGARTRFQFAL